MSSMVSGALTVPGLPRNPLPRRLAIALAIAAGLLAALLNIKDFPPLVESIEQRLVFDPIPVDPDLLRSIGTTQGVQEVHVPMPDGIVLHGWLKRPERLRAGERYPLVIVYGGVRREISDIVLQAHAPGRWGWLMVNYRGFGLSGGVPSERAVLEDAKRVYDWAASQPDVDAQNIVLLGRSLGSYVAVKVAAPRRSWRHRSIAPSRWAKSAFRSCRCAGSSASASIRFRSRRRCRCPRSSSSRRTTRSRQRRTASPSRRNGAD
jgi:hypothetical protein